MSDSKVWLRYEGTSDAFREKGVVLERNGLPQEVDADRVEFLKSQPGHDFKVVDAADAEAAHKAASPQSAPGEDEVRAEHEEAAEAAAEARGAFYGADTQEEADEALGIEPEPVFIDHSEDLAEDEDELEDNDAGDLY